jgi:hypothetical protein
MTLLLLHSTYFGDDEMVSSIRIVPTYNKDFVTGCTMLAVPRGGHAEASAMDAMVQQAYACFSLLGSRTK